jgi:hypothetical protein
MRAMPQDGRLLRCSSIEAFAQRFQELIARNTKRSVTGASNTRTRAGIRKEIVSAFFRYNAL